MGIQIGEQFLVARKVREDLEARWRARRADADWASPGALLGASPEDRLLILGLGHYAERKDVADEAWSSIRAGLPADTDRRGAYVAIACVTVLAIWGALMALSGF